VQTCKVVVTAVVLVLGPEVTMNQGLNVHHIGRRNFLFNRYEGAML
jgi:hypothetical protein